MTAKLAATLICAAAFGSTAPALAAGSKEAGQTKSPRVACHGIDGNSANPSGRHRRPARGYLARHPGFGP
jgi:hypothetical protein